MGTFVGRWRGEERTAGGSPVHASFLENPQFRLQLSVRQQDVQISLKQPDASGRMQPIGFVVIHAADVVSRRKTLGKPGGTYGYQALVAVRPGPAAFKPIARVVSWLKLERAELPFIIVPCTLDPGCDADFLLEVNSNFPCLVDQLPQKVTLLPYDAIGRPAPQTSVRLVAQRGGPLHERGAAEIDTPLPPELTVILSAILPGGSFEDDSFGSLSALATTPSSQLEDSVAWVRPRKIIAGPVGTLKAQAAIAAESALLPSPTDWWSIPAGRWDSVSGQLGGMGRVAQQAGQATPRPTHPTTTQPNPIQLHSTPHQATPHHATLHHIAPHHQRTSPLHTTPHQATPRHTTLHHITSHRQRAAPLQATPAGEWLLGALGVVSSSPAVLYRCFPFGLFSGQGVLAVNLYRSGKWVLVLTDDSLPTVDGRLLFGGAAAPQHVTRHPPRHQSIRPFHISAHSRDTINTYWSYLPWPYHGHTMSIP